MKNSTGKHLANEISPQVFLLDQVLQTDRSKSSAQSQR